MVRLLAKASAPNGNATREARFESTLPNSAVRAFAPEAHEAQSRPGGRHQIRKITATVGHSAKPTSIMSTRTVRAQSTTALQVSSYCFWVVEGLRDSWAIRAGRELLWS